MNNQIEIYAFLNVLKIIKCIVGQFMQPNECRKKANILRLETCQLTRNPILLLTLRKAEQQARRSGHGS